MGQARAQQPVQLRRRGGDPIQEGLQLLLELVSWRRLKVQAPTADGACEHLHRSPIAQPTDPTSAQAIGATGEQALVPLIQLGQDEGRSKAIVYPINTSSTGTSSTPPNAMRGESET